MDDTDLAEDLGKLKAEIQWLHKELSLVRTELQTLKDRRAESMARWVFRLSMLLISLAAGSVVSYVGVLLTAK